MRVWCGPAADPFYLDLHHLAHVLEGLQNEQPIENGEWTPAQAASTFTGSQICAIVLEIPHSDVELGRAAGSACGPAPSLPPTPAVGARSTELASR